MTRGWRQRDIESAVRAGEIIRLQQNRYVRERVWRDLWPESRHLIQVVAAHAEMRGGGAVASYESSGVLHGIPLYRHVPERVHVTLPTGGRSSSRVGLIRHREELPDEDTAERGGIPCTSLERTTFDAARTLSYEAALTFADAALRQVAWSEDGYDFNLAEAWRSQMLERVGRFPGARGIRQAADAIRFADGRAELPGESVTRLQLARLGFTQFELQVPVAGPNRSVYRVDLDLEEVATFLEFDGHGKYLAESLRSGRSLDDVLLAEKRREDWIRGVTQRRFVRVEDAHIGSAEALASRLAAFGISIPGR